MGFGYRQSGEAVEWMILTIGHLSVNKFWGETERRRGALCTCTLLRTTDGLAIIDPSVPPEQMAALLNDQAGLRSEDVATVLLTHFHGDHRFGLEAFPGAKWYMAAAEIVDWQPRVGAADAALLERILPADDTTLPGCRLLPTPGHTLGHHSLLFSWRGRRVAVAGDAAMTEDFYRAGEGYHNSVDMAQARASIDLLGHEADVIIPGHDNVFVPTWAPRDAAL